VAAQIAFARIPGGKYQVKISVDPAEVDKKYAEIKQGLEQKVNTIMNDPRMKSGASLHHSSKLISRWRQRTTRCSAGARR